MRFSLAVLAVSLCGVFASPALARDLAYVVDLNDYRFLQDLPRDRRMSAMVSELESAGFEVTFDRNPTLGQLRAAAFALETAVLADSDRVVVILRGHLMGDAADTWLLGQEVRQPDKFDIGSKGVPLNIFRTTLGAASGRAVLALIDDPRPLDTAGGLRATALTVPDIQGVTTLAGDSAAVQRAVSGLLQAGATTGEIAADVPAVRLGGFVSDRVPFTAQDGQGGASDTDLGQIAYWSAVRDIGTTEALLAYLNRYPQGLFAADARRQIAGIEADRENRLKSAELALGLNRDSRRDIQRDLALLGYDPRGIDGVFGPATRRAIIAWQTDEGFDAHGYLDRDQRALMQEAALRRAAELEEEARRRRQIEEARDRAFWQETGARRTEAGFRQYLREFPDGLFADIARDELEDIEAARRSEMDARERAAWDDARGVNTVAAYRSFLTNYPEGVFAEAAKTRIDELTEESRDAEMREQYIRVERSVAGNGAARLLIEGRLAGLGLDPGDVDGNFTPETRRAIRRFQRARDLDVTGFVDQPTMVQLLLGR